MPRPALTGEGKSRTATAWAPLRLRAATLGTPRAHWPLRPASRGAGEGCKSPHVRPPCCEAARRLPLGAGRGPGGPPQRPGSNRAQRQRNPAPARHPAPPAPQDHAGCPRTAAGRAGVRLSHGRGRGLRRGGPRSGLPRPGGGGLRRRKVCRVAGGGRRCEPPRPAFSRYFLLHTPPFHPLPPLAAASGHELDPPPALRGGRSRRARLCQ